ncbi:MAG: GGDEF domain-containing protein [Myxococcota bacterium]
MAERQSGWRFPGLGKSARGKTFRGLPARITLFVFWATVITSMAVSALSIGSIQSFLRSNIDQKYPALLATGSDRLDLWYEQRTLEMGVFASSEILRENLPLLNVRHSSRSSRARGEVEQYLSYLLESFTQYRQLLILDHEGRRLIYSGESLELPPALLAVPPVVASPSVGAVHKMGEQRIQVVTAGLGSPSQPPLFTLHAVLDLGALDALLAREDVGSGMRAVVVDEVGAVIASNDPNVLGSTHRWPVADRDADAVVGGYEGPDGFEMVGGRLGIDRLGWTLVVEEPYDRAFAPVVSSISKIAVIDLAIILLFGLGAHRIAVSIVRPVEALSDAARRMAEGEEHVVIPERGSRDEMGLLIRTFNTMTISLANKARELELSRRQVEDANQELTGRNDELQRVNEILEQLSITDGLTQLHNHRFFQDHLSKEARRVDRTGEPLALILADIDYFKLWNDRLGHAGGDRILREVAALMNELIRETDLLARYGGEEFALLAPGTDTEGAVALAEKIRAEIAAHVFVESEPGAEPEPGAPRAVTLSFGVAAYDGDRDRFFEAADRALYAAKDAGRDCVVNAADLDS